ncbi:uncharacterized protein LOC128722616 [Anopheles nili]|uniref:uncharacterized protein LOC128722616 n=1 Tax=Anopheles nili TaxID=185578 RepID=UPI00237A792D|nr:uncharacterized protein LOC128722616 [Anopheles nili]
MATRRPRVKVAANLSTRRPAKSGACAGEQAKPEADVSVPNDRTDAPSMVDDVANSTPKPLHSVPDEDSNTNVTSPGPDKREEQMQEFKLPKPVDDIGRSVASSSLTGIDAFSSPVNTHVAVNHTFDEPQSPRKQETRPPFPLPFGRKRNRTESLTSNKSLSEGVTVNKVTRKVATKQEESQRTLDSKKEIRKRLTNIENVDKQNLTMFDMIYYNPVNNPMTPPALSKRGSLENIPKSVEGRDRGRTRSRSVSKSRSPTPAPSSSALPPTPKPEPVQLTPQLKLGPNGEMILDEASLVIENEREKEMRETLANTDIVYQDEFSGNSGYYSRIRRTKDWDDDETVRFYRCLHTIGTDFSMMLTLFPKRSRRDLKLKFKKEERLNLQLVNKALLHPKQFNIDELRQQFAHEDAMLELQKQEEQQRRKDEREKQDKEILKKKLLQRLTKTNNPQRRLSRSERVMTDEMELTIEDLKETKRKVPSRKRSIVKPKVIKDAVPLEDALPLDEGVSKMVSNDDVVPKIVLDNGMNAAPKPFEHANKPESGHATADVVLNGGPIPHSSMGPFDEPFGSEADDPDAPFVVYEKSAESYDNPSTTNMSIVKYQCIDDEEDAYPESNATADEQNSTAIVEQYQDESTTVITLQNLDDQSHTTCLRTDVSAPLASTVINELTPVEIKYDEYVPESDLVFLPDEPSKASSVKEEQLYAAKPNQVADSGDDHTNPGNAPLNVQLISWPSNSGTTSEPLPIVVALNTYGSSCGTLIIPDQQPPSQALLLEQKQASDQPVENEIGKHDLKHQPNEPPGNRASSPSLSSEQSSYAEPSALDRNEAKIVPDMSLKNEIPNPPKTSVVEPADQDEFVAEIPMKSAADESPDMDDAYDNVEHNPTESDEDDEEEDGGFSLDGIDINSLVLVESQDTVDPNKTFYEIYVSHPETGQLSEKPLNVPADVIENIRLILEAADR